MTKWTHLAVSGLTALSLLTIPTPSQAEDNVRILINGVQQSFDVAPYIQNDRTFIPLRGVLEKLGAQVFWNEDMQEVIVKRGDTFVTLEPYWPFASVNGAEHELDVEPELKNDRVMVPLRFLIETFGEEVQWDGATNTVKISSKSQPVTSNKQFNMYVNTDIATLEPSQVTYDYEWNVLKQLYEGLVRINDAGMPVPGVAEAWDVSTDGLTYTFHLRDTAKWSDGSPVTAADFEYGWKRAIDIESSNKLSFLFEGIKGVKNYRNGPGSLREIGIRATDDRTLTVTLESPMPWFASMIAMPIFSPQKKSFVESHDWYGMFADEVLTNGPFTVKDWSPTEMMMEKSDTYWDRSNVSLDNVHVLVMPAFQPETLATLYEGGAVDEMVLHSSILPQYQKDPDYQFVDSLSTGYVQYNERNLALANAKIRQALMYAIDPADFSAQTYGVRGSAATGLVPTGISDGMSGEFRQRAGDVLQYQTRTADAKQLLAEGVKELGLTKLPTLTFLAQQSSVGEKVGSYLQSHWHDALGIDVKVVAEPASTLFQHTAAGKFDISFTEWGADFDDPMTFLDLFRSDNTSNETGYHNAAYDALLKKANAEQHPVERYRLMADMERMIVQDAVVSPYIFTHYGILCKPYVQGFSYSKAGQTFDLKGVSMQGK